MQVIKFESIPSTNSTLLEFSKKGAKSWTCIWTSNQTAGRGYAGNDWLSQLDKNLAVSILLKVELDFHELIVLNKWVCNHLRRYLSLYSPMVSVKWPNDIIMRNKKVCGVLIETHKIDKQLNIIIGIGLNINQTQFEALPNAGSILTQTGAENEIEEILSGLLTELKDNFYEIQEKLFTKIVDEYNLHLFRKDRVSVFEKEGVKFNGMIEGVDQEGRLLVKLEDGTNVALMHKDVKLHY